MKGSARRFPVVERVRTSLWFVPAVSVAVGAALSFVLVALDRGIGEERSAWYLFGGGPQSARNLVSTIAAAMITSISLIFSVTMVVLQLASAQYSPRVLRTFIRDRLVQAVLGVYIATFVYSLLVLPAIRSEQGGDPAFVPAVAVSASLGLALVSLALFVRYIDHIAHAIRAVTLLSSVAEETRAALSRMYPEELGADADEDLLTELPQPTTVVQSEDGPGVVVAVDEDRLLGCATNADVVVRIVPMVGEFVPTNGPVFEVVGELTDDQRRAMLQCVGIARERTMHQDPGFGFRQIVDIAERALSPGVNDPTTAVQAIDELHDLLRRLADRRFPSRARVDDGGVLRVVAPRYAWDDYVELAFDEIRHYGRGSIQVARRMRGALDDLRTVAPEHRRAALERQLRLLEESTRRDFPDEADTRRAQRGALIS
ncbi:MAG: DUF2254 domain-containing protein [Actinobacteria bacterium]|nr:DUF2254 domain-containing protein [Actinomycetota bacterium]